MGSTERRERERVEVRRKILDAARDLFAREGYERVTMRRIADAIEYSATTIYNHFEDKDALLNSLCEDEFGRLLTLLAKGARPRSAVAWIRQLGLAYARFGLEYPNHYRFMFMTAHSSDGEGEKPPAGEQTFGLLRGVVDQAIAAGRLRDLPRDTISQVLWSAVHGVVALLVTYGEKFPCVPPVADLAAQAMENALRGILKEPA